MRTSSKVVGNQAACTPIFQVQAAFRPQKAACTILFAILQAQSHYRVYNRLTRFDH
ncbi:hypothetical protein [Kingella denitrificans]